MAEGAYSARVCRSRCFKQGASRSRAQRVGVSFFRRTDFSTPTRPSPNQIVLVWRSPAPHGFFLCIHYLPIYFVTWRKIHSICVIIIHYFLLSIYFIFSHIKQHSIQNITKQNNRHILNISKSSQKGGREGRTIKTQKSLLYTITYIKQKTLPSINGRRPGPTDSRRCTFTSHYLQEATDPIFFSTHVRCKPVLYYCLLRSCKTSKQHSLLHWTYTETRIIIKKTQTWVNRPINSQ